MGQKSSCFKEFDILRLIGRKRKKRNISEMQTVDRAAYVINNVPSDIDEALMPSSEGIGHAKYFSLKPVNPETVTKTSGITTREDIYSTQAPDFEIKDGTIILGPSRSNVFHSSNSSASEPFGVSSPRTTENLKNISEEVAENNYYHSLPYIPPKPPISIFNTDFDDKKPITDTKIAPPPIPPRKHEIIIEAGSEKSDSQFHGKVVPPPIPPRLHERPCRY